MNKFQNILYVVENDGVCKNAIHDIATLVEDTGAHFSILVLLPVLPADMENMYAAFEKGMTERIHKKLQGYNLKRSPKIVFETTTPHFVTVIQHVLKNDYDLVVKMAEAPDNTQKKGFKSLDMSLLRKCPCPVWLHRDTGTNDAPRILTAIDPLSDAKEARDLNTRLLQIGQSLAQILGGTNTVMSCWNIEHEEFLRNSPFAGVTSEDLDALIQKEEQEHKNAVEQTIRDSGLDISNIVCKKGWPQDVIPSYTVQEKIDLIVMGTVARTGIPGFFIGNTAENIIQNLSCDMFAVKPVGFVSPIKAN